ncbi:hypothetical protein [Iodobacter fluviatilis]|uniref:DUF4145 domain-containing protein n=1 Tax=Iodobacter fluviatilis TaxID=537 RepID=A0A377SUW8_9NEIS|nr:hypothetical protein [Iodobacter fluviatilis]TCU81617.1 hypothetical protein EV682_12017 [Iodobacter fluviatilis]STR44783.1 Uncharacterised protein [Iodobacter fluviatilis]
MDWLTFISKIAETVAWPFVVIVIFLNLKDNVQELFPILRKLKYKDFEAEFGEGVRDISEKLPAGDTQKSAESAGEPSSLREQLYRLSETAPRAAVLESWLQVEHAAQRLVSRADIADGSLRRMGPAIMRNYLEKTGTLSEQQLESFNKLRSLRNKVVHFVEVSLPIDEVLEYVDLSLSLASQFDAA